MRFAFAALLLAAFSTPAFAQDATAPEALNQVYACAEIADESQRLACYDAAVGRLREAQSSGAIVAVDREQAEEIERDAFGFSLPSLPRIFGGEGGDRPAFTETELTIDRISRRSATSAVFYMTNGQVWEQVGGDSSRHVRSGVNVTIRRAALGSYMMSMETGGRALRVRRQE